jgi:hypothetical protein
MAMIWLAGCSGGSDNSTPSQTGTPPGSTPPPGSNTPPGNTTPQPTAQVGRFNAPVVGIISVPNGNGDIYVAGHFTTYNNQPVRPVVRLRPNGTINDGFKLTDAVSRVGEAAVVTTVIVAADDGSGDLYLSDTLHVWKVNSSGAIASGFTTGELTYINRDAFFDVGPILYAMAPVGDGSGRVYLGGIFDRYNGTPVNHFVRLNTNGTIDPAFIPNTDVGWIWNILPAKDGSGDLYVINYGNFRGTPSGFEPGFLRRLNLDGTIDPGFLMFRGVDGPPYTVTHVEDGSGDLFVTGGFMRVPENTIIPRPGFVRLNSDGSLDETSPRLNSDGTPDPTSTWPQLMFPKFLTKATDGTNDWFAVTNPNVLNGSLDPSEVQRRKADGTLDTTFTAGQASGLVGPECNLCNGISFVLPAPDATGDIYVAGGFTTYNSVAVGHIVRLNADGTLEQGG